ncbi:endonuclease/exonuclease/phosphatase family protein [Luteimonas suaedae]|uniref:endonuclease/exonuclease/phosphatase family protein n=1 Tax=Luteimonas suaedae TaxID=2605430 RepID=UPI001658D0D9|nr:endonuclease/exonuclease/phosphatase family protein [Luteimonas suaedae]
MANLDPAAAAGGTYSPYPPSQGEHEAPELRFGTYNVGGGNSGARSGFAETAAHIAGQVVNGDIDVVALQEVDVGTERALNANGSDDYSMLILAQISAKEAGLQGEVQFERYSIDENGQQVPYEARHPVTVIEGTDPEGRSSQVKITREHYNENGQRVDAGDGSGVITVYNADVRSPNGSQDYAIVYGSSTATGGGTYGNAVLLGPGASLQRDFSGNAVVTRHDLGANDANGENRTALAVDIVAGGEPATVISTHFSNDDEQARETQYANLAGIAGGYGDNTVVLGDFNSREETLGGMEGDNDPGFWAWADPIDRIYTSDDVESSDRDHVEGGESDHSLLTWNVRL